jgi:hypothetical protein
MMPNFIQFEASSIDTASLVSTTIGKMEMFRIDLEMDSLLNEMDNEELQAFAETQGYPLNDAEKELLIYIRFRIFSRAESVEYLERAIRLAESWWAIIPRDHPDHARRSKILDMLSAKICERKILTEGTVYLLILIEVTKRPQTYYPQKTTNGLQILRI